MTPTLFARRKEDPILAELQARERGLTAFRRTIAELRADLSYGDVDALPDKLDSAGHLLQVFQVRLPEPQRYPGKASELDGELLLLSAEVQARRNNLARQLEATVADLSSFEAALSLARDAVSDEISRVPPENRPPILRIDRTA